jgi:hypothetical protein
VVPPQGLAVAQVLLAALANAALAAEGPIVELVMNQPPSIVGAPPASSPPFAGFIAWRGGRLPPMAPEQVDVRRPLGLEAVFACRTAERVTLGARVDWGDGASGPATIVSEPAAPAWLKTPAELAALGASRPQQGRITATHEYAVAEMYTIRLTLEVTRESDGVKTSFVRAHRLRVRDPALAEQPWRFEIGPITAVCANGEPCNFPLELDATMEARAPFRFGPSWLAGQTARWDWGDGKPGPGTVSATGGVGRAIGTHAYTRGGKYKVTLTLSARHKDGTPESRTQTIDLVAADVALDAVVPPSGPLSAGFPADFRGTFRYGDPKRQRRATWTWGDGRSAAGELSERDGVGSVFGQHTFPKAGVYKVRLAIADGLAEVTTAAEVTVSSPGSVSATGTIPCPAGVFITDKKRSGSVQLELSGRHDGAVPSGTFRLTGAGFEFTAERFDSLAIGKSEAHAAGNGTLNGRGPYSFNIDVWTAAGQDGQAEIPLARIRIQDLAQQREVFDNDVFDGALQSMTGASLTFTAP